MNKLRSNRNYRARHAGDLVNLKPGDVVPDFLADHFKGKGWIQGREPAPRPVKKRPMFKVDNPPALKTKKGKK